MYCGVASYARLKAGFWNLLRDVLLNTGGPRSRTRRECVRSSILANPSFSIFWPKKRPVGLIFPDHLNPLEILDGIMEKKGFRDPDVAKAVYHLPSGILFCRSIKETEGVGEISFPDTTTSGDDEVLKTALILGLCNKHFYDFGHSVIWTENRLRRKLNLYRVGDFYAND